MNARISVNQRSCPKWSLDEALDHFESIGIDAIGIDVEALFRVDDDTLDIVGIHERLDSAGMRITNLRVPGLFDLADPDRWHDERETASRVMDLALELRPDVITFASGSPGTLPWERAADSFHEAMHQIIMEAEREDLTVAIEHTDPMLVDTGFIHTLHDALDMSWRMDTGVCMVIDSCWSERNLVGTIAAGVDRISLVRVADRAIGDRVAGTSLVPGDGDIPLGRIIRQLLDAGYPGWFDILVTDPRTAPDGYADAILRARDHLTGILEESGDHEDPTKSENSDD